MDKRNDSLTTHEIIERLIKSNEAMLHAAKTAQFEFIEVPGGLIARPTAPTVLVNAMKRAEEGIQMAVNTCRDVTSLGRFSNGVDPVRWVQALEDHLKSLQWPNLRS